MSAVLDCKTVKARKQHRCCMCNLPIEKGEMHTVQSMVDEDGHYRIRIHAGCERILPSLNMYAHREPMYGNQLSSDGFRDTVLDFAAEFLPEYEEKTCWDIPWSSELLAAVVKFLSTHKLVANGPVEQCCTTFKCIEKP